MRDLDIEAGVLTKQIDEIDAKILKDLLTDARKSFQAIAKECKVTKNAIWKHFRKLEKEGIIVGSTLQLNYKKLGYKAVATLGILVDPRQTEQVITDIRKMSNIYSANPMCSKYNARAIVTLKTVEELDNVKAQIKKLAGVSDLKAYIWIETRNIPENLSIEPDQNSVSAPYLREAQTYMSKDLKKIDDIDMQIIDQLGKNSRVAFSKIAEKIGITPDTVSRRYRNLEQGRIIKSVIQVDLTKLGYRAGVAFYAVLTGEIDLLKTMDALSQIPDIVFVMKTFGDYDLQISAPLKDINQQLTIQEGITRIPCIKIVSISVYRLGNVSPFRLEVTSTI
jgi:Lrp/AsnC family transcriptional regulator for asnA, asnC and gidA